MTNEEAIRHLSQMYLIQFDKEEHESLTIAINSIQENTKLKAEIEQLKYVAEVNERLVKQNEKLKWKLSSTETQRDLKGYDAKRNADIMSSQLKIIEQLKSEIERYKKLISKMCESCEYEDLLGYEYPCENCTHYSNWKLKCEVFDE